MYASKKFRICSGLNAGFLNSDLWKVILLTLSPRRSTIIDGSPHSTGALTPFGGLGAYLPTNPNVLPVKSSGGQVEKAIMPPGFKTLSISLLHTSGLGANIWPN